MFSLKVKCSAVQPKRKPKKVLPNCKDCKYSLKEDGLDVCKLFKYHNVFNSDGYTVVDGIYFSKQTNCFHYYVDVENCREDQTLCGYYGEYFKPKNNLKD